MTPRRCSVEGCEKKVNARGWCPMHYERWKKSGDPNIARPTSVPRIALPGERYGRLVVTRGAPPAKCGERQVVARCDCGGHAVVFASALSSGHTRSCGCLSRERAAERGAERWTTHGHTASGQVSPEYYSWAAMLLRCTNPSHKDWANYGARGIRISTRWLDSFPNFLADMGPRPEGHTLDRIDPEGDYEPANCRWATAKEQRTNQRKPTTHEQEGAR